MTSVKTIFLIAIFTLLALVNKSHEKTTKLSQLRVPANEEIKSILPAEKNDQPHESSIKKRSPQFDEIYGDYTESRHLKLGRRRNKHRRPHHGTFGGAYGGCRGRGCAQGHGWRPQHPGHSHQIGQSLASATAGSSSHNNGVGQSQASAQSSTFSLGPYSATFSKAEASAGNL